MTPNHWHFLWTRGTRVSSSLAWFSLGESGGWRRFVKLARVFPGTLVWRSGVAQFLGLRSSWSNHFFQVRAHPWFTHRKNCFVYFLFQTNQQTLNCVLRKTFDSQAESFFWQYDWNLLVTNDKTQEMSRSQISTKI